MSDSWRSDAPPSMIEGRPTVGWSTHLREATRVIARLVALGALDEAQAARCREALSSAVPDPDEWLLFSVDLAVERDRSLAEISFWIDKVQGLTGGQQPPQEKVAAALGPSSESHLRGWLMSIRAAVTEVWPEIALTRVSRERERLLRQVLEPHGASPERVVRQDRFLEILDEVAAQIGDSIRRPEECAEAIAAGLLGLSRDFLRDVILDDSSPRRPTDPTP